MLLVGQRAAYEQGHIKSTPSWEDNTNCEEDKAATALTQNIMALPLSYFAPMEKSILRSYGGA